MESILNAWTGFGDAVRLGGWVVYPLSLLAVAALAITLDRAYALWRFARLPNGVPEWFGHSERGDSGRSVTDLLGDLPRNHACCRLARLLDDAGAPVWRLEAKLEAVAARIERDMSRGLWLLETIVTAAPLLGLLGTIVGMMRAFRLIGGDGLVNPSGVTGGVAQALVATAIGLVIALVALFAYNYFARRIDRLMEELESFANELLSDARLADEARGGRS
jgi:biopolymer transport protein ExbB